ncbi:IS607 family element RNA-guided endonuclease TnpB [Actinomadura rifamycini]|uniref:IS607 family element RNA-guided endonuclease TnpB n=1 Tax=Actinomadura rifamycini TaxID=31962 RepID=UPI00068746E8|nr:IS607 family element RNA-guided endonuclease TnpB [Actinomadura rifamycini]
MSDRPGDDRNHTGGRRGFEPAPGCVLQAYVFVLDPGVEAERALEMQCGAARFAFNWALSRVKANQDQREAERSYGITGTDLTPSASWSPYTLRKAFNQVKDQVAPWWRECSKEAYNTGFAGAATALRNWDDSRKGRRKGPRAGFPKFKTKRRTVPSCRFTTGTIRVEDRRHVTLPRVGTIRTHESTRKLDRRLVNGSARILSATVSHRRGRWQVSFHCEVQRARREPARPDAVAGVDLGVAKWVVIADSEGHVRTIVGPRHLDYARHRLRRAGRTAARRRGPAVRDPATGTFVRRAPSRRWVKAQQKLGRIHLRVANLRRDAVHKLTTSLVREYGTVVVEDLNVAGMLRNRRLARRIADGSFGEIRRQLTYKTGWNGGTLVVADRWFPSSKLCSGCGAVKAKLSLHTRVHRCDECGLTLDRDVNAALNLAALAGRMAGAGVAGHPGPQGPNARGASP